MNSQNFVQTSIFTRNWIDKKLSYRHLVLSKSVGSTFCVLIACRNSEYPWLINVFKIGDQITPPRFATISEDEILAINKAAAVMGYTLCSLYD